MSRAIPIFFFVIVDLRYTPLNRRYAGRITEISRDQFNSITQYFTSDDTDENYQEEVERTTATLNPPEVPAEPQYEVVQGKKKLVTDAALAKYCKTITNFTCEINPSHVSFISKVTGNNFVEVHHLIPLKAQSEFTKTLDNPANIVSLCPNCHRLLHHATASGKKDHLKVLLDDTREKALKRYNTSITTTKLLQYYW